MSDRYVFTGLFRGAPWSSRGSARELITDPGCPPRVGTSGKAPFEMNSVTPPTVPQECGSDKAPAGEPRRFAVFQFGPVVGPGVATRRGDAISDIRRTRDGAGAGLVGRPPVLASWETPVMGDREPGPPTHPSQSWGGSLETSTSRVTREDPVGSLPSAGSASKASRTLFAGVFFSERPLRGILLGPSFDLLSISEPAVALVGGGGLRIP